MICCNYNSVHVGIKVFRGISCLATGFFNLCNIEFRERFWCVKETLSRYSTCLWWKRLVSEPARSLGHLSAHRREQRLGEGGVHGKVQLLVTLGFDQCCPFVKMKLSFCLFFFFLLNRSSSYDPFWSELELITVVWWVDTNLIYGHSSVTGTNFVGTECICE